MDEFSSSVMKLWKEWNVRVTVLLSLTLQIMLVVLGNRRKHDSKLWIKIVLWCAYLSADFIAIYALGVITNNISHFREKNGESMNANTELTAFWAPFLLMHLGGPDTITAYSLEDNELWLRHLLGLVVQMVMAIYVCVMAWTGSLLSFLSLLMLFAGLIKYGERTWVLRKASSEIIRESYAYLNIDQKHSELLAPIGFHDGNLVIAHRLMDLLFYPLFLDVSLSHILYLFRYEINLKASSDDIFQIIEMSFALMYNNLCTKTLVLYSRGGLSLRVIIVILTSTMSILFTVLIHKHKFSKIDVTITFILLFGAIILDIYSALSLLFSDKFQLWLTKHQKRWLDRFKGFKNVLPKKKRWSNKMSQLNLLSITLKEKTLPYHNFLKHFRIVEKLENQWYATAIEIPNDLKILIFRYLQKKVQGQITQSESPSTNEYGMNFTNELEKSILAWHIATEKWYYEIDREDINGKGHVIELICQISRYMFSLQVLHPNMLSNANTTNFTLLPILVAARGLSFRKIEAHKVVSELLKDAMSNVQDVTMNLEGLDESIYRFFSNDLPEFLEKLGEQSWEERWMRISCTWLEMLPYAACKCRGMQHAHRLKCGGEFLTHVWLLTIFFGLHEKDFTSHAPNWANSVIGFGGASLERPDLLDSTSDTSTEIQRHQDIPTASKESDTIPEIQRHEDMLTMC